MENYNNNLESYSEEYQNNREGKHSKLFIISGLLFFVICIIGFFAAYMISGNIFNRQTVIFEPSCHTAQNCDDGLLEETALRLSNRAHQYGYTSTKFRVNGDGLLVGYVPEGTDITQLTNEISSKGALEFVDFGETYIPPNTIVQTDYASTVQDENEPVYHTVLTDEFLQAVNVVETDGTISLAISFDQEGTKILLEFTANNVGKYLGIVKNNEVISCPNINAIIPNGEAIISGDFTYDEANELAISLRFKQLPYEITLVE